MEGTRPATAVGPRLSVMMFLQFLTWGAWYVTQGNFITVTTKWPAGTDPEWVNGWAYSVAPIAAMIAPLFLGMVADRFFASERVLGVLMLIGAVCIGAAPTFATGETKSAGLFLLCLLGHTLCFMPTLGLTNTIAFANMTNRERQFPLVRVFGTLGWIAAGLFISIVLKADFDERPFYVAAASSAALGIYAFTLPHTPPPARGTKPSFGQLLGLDAVKMMRETSFAAFIVSSMLICIPLAAYYAKAQTFVGATGFEKPAFIMTFGQMSEVFFMLVMPLFFARLGVKWMLAVGMLAWVVRYGLFSGAAEDHVRWMILAGVILHGICYDFFFVTGQIYTDKKAPPQLRGQAQGFLVLMTQGVGLFVGAQLTALLASRYTTTAGVDWKSFWSYPAIAAAVVLIVFVAVFRDRVVSDAPEGEVAAAAEREDLV
jgi:nucleoside transporter